MKFIACLITVALLLSLWVFPAFAEKNRTKIPRLVSPLKTQTQDMPVIGRNVEKRVQDPELDRRVRRYDLVKIDSEAATKQVKNRGRLVLNTSRGNFDLEFTPYDLRAWDYSAQEIGIDGVARELPKTPLNTFKATVKGNARAQARMSVGLSGLEGAIITDTDKYFIQPARDLSKTAQSDEFIFYSEEDVVETDDSCGVTLAEEVAARAELAAANSDTDITSQLNSPVTPLSPMKVARIATDADAEYVASTGGSAQANAQITNIMNVVDGIYQVEIGVTFQIVFQNAWTNENTDPYTTTDAADLLTQFRNYWNANFTEPTRSLAHLWTGKDLDGQTIGIASVGVVCRSPNGAYGLSQRFPTAGPDARTIILTAHEIGHNFSAAHTNAVGKDVPPEFSISCDNSIMESGLGNRPGSSFCTFSRSQISGHANAYDSCLLNSATSPPSSSCTEIPITPGQLVNGTITTSDCGSPSRGGQHFADRYWFDATMGQQISTTLKRTSGTLDPYLYLIAPDGNIIDQAEFGADGTNARIPEVANFGVLTLPQTGRYTIEATSSVRGQTGDYELILNVSTCVLNASASVQHFSAAGGSANLNVTVSGGCLGYTIVVDPGTTGSNWILPSEGGGFGSRNFGFIVSPNGNSLGRRSFILISPNGANSDTAGLRIPITQAGTGGECSTTPIFVGQTLDGQLANNDCESPIRITNGLRADRYRFTASAGQQVSITLNAGAQNPLSDPFLTLIGPHGAVLLNDDDSGGGTNSRVPGGTGMLTLGLPGTYIIEVSSFSSNQLGTYALTLAGTSPNWQPTSVAPNQIEMKNWTVNGRTFVYAKLNFPDTGYRVIDWGAPSQSGNAFTVNATVEHFNGSNVPAISSNAQIWDLGALSAGNYSFTLTTLGTNAKVHNFTVSSTPPPTNPIDGIAGAREFVRWQYKDFLRREPDGPGWDHWTSEITMCANPTNRFPGETEPACIERKRANTSAAFFFSPEFSNTGYFVLRVYRGSLGRMPKFGGGTGAGHEFTRDAATVAAGIVVNNALDPNVINANKQAFVNEFVTRPEFRAIYDGLSATQYVNKLFATTGVTPTDIERNALIAEAGTAAGRASVLFKVVDGTTTVTGGLLVFNTNYGKAFYDNLFNAAFVQMEYFGYLLRDPDPDGYNFWLGKLNQFGNWVDAQMVLAFISSPEYRSRFGSP